MRNYFDPIPSCPQANGAALRLFLSLLYLVHANVPLSFDNSLVHA